MLLRNPLVSKLNLNGWRPKFSSSVISGEWKLGWNSDESNGFLDNPGSTKIVSAPNFSFNSSESSESRGTPGKIRKSKIKTFRILFY